MTKNDIEPRSVSAAEPYELPAGWKWVRLGDVAEIARGGSPRPIEKYITTAEDGINWIKIGDTEKDGKYIFSTKEKIIKEGLSKTRYVEEGDFLLTNSMSFGRPYILKTSGCIHDGWLVIKKCTAYNQDFLYYLLSSTFVFNQFALLAKGSTVKNLKSETVRQVVLPLPTLSEQQRIVSRIESMFTKLDEAKDKAQSVVDGFETRKAAILHKAFTGELTAKWRKEHGVSDDSWEEKTIGEIVTGFKYGISDKCDYKNSGLAVLRIPNIEDGTLNFSDLKYTERTEIEDNYIVQNNDILIIRSNGSRDIVGKSALFKQSNGVYTYGSFLIKITPLEIVLPEYLIIYLNSQDARYQMFKKAKSSSGIHNINSKELSVIKINLPTLPEQQEIVRILDTVLEKESRAKEAAGTVLDQIALLKKSILARAFRGEI